MKRAEPHRLATKDPWIEVEEARAQRGLIVACWLRAAFAHQSRDPFRRLFKFVLLTGNVRLQQMLNALFAKWPTKFASRLMGWQGEPVFALVWRCMLQILAAFARPF